MGHLLLANAAHVIFFNRSHIKLSMHGVKEVIFYLKKVKEVLLGSYGAHVHSKSGW